MCTCNVECLVRHEEMEDEFFLLLEGFDEYGGAVLRNWLLSLLKRSEMPLDT